MVLVIAITGCQTETAETAADDRSSADPFRPNQPRMEDFRWYDPLPAPIEKGALRVVATPWLRVPRSVDMLPSTPKRAQRAESRGARRFAGHAALQYLAPVPDHRFRPQKRLAFNDTHGILYLTDTSGAPPSVYLDLSRAGVDFYNGNHLRESGFMGFAFHPQFANKRAPGYGKLYTAFSATSDSGVANWEDEGAIHHSVIMEWTASDPAASVFEGTAREVMRVGQWGAGHNVGTIAFNPNAKPGSADFGLLYIGLGDGGNACDPRDHSQTLSAPLGAIARIDPLGGDEDAGYGIPADNPFVDRAGAAAEIWARGLRHPQQFSWDARDGRMFIADIGQHTVEEVNIGIAGGNYGWRLREGTFAIGCALEHVWPLPEEDDANFIYPVAQYDHDEGSAIGGGYVYRSDGIPALRGKYVFTDIPKGRVFALDADELGGGELPASIEEVRLIFDGEEKSLIDVAGFGDGRHIAPRVDARIGIDHDGELYLLTKGDGWIRKLTRPSTDP